MLKGNAVSCSQLPLSAATTEQPLMLLNHSEKICQIATTIDIKNRVSREEMGAEGHRVIRIEMYAMWNYF